MNLRIACALLIVALVPAAPASAATGVSEERVSLPDGPGSLEGIGENVELNLNMGAMSYAVPIQVPQGFPGLTPTVSLAYSSTNGASVAGMGWMLAMPSIERLTVRGLPRYTTDDEMSVDGGEELVYVDGTEPRTYRARFEKGFVRYRWHEPGDGSEGWWTAEFPNGLVSTYGATSAGTPAPDARVGGDNGTFRWHLVETVDRYGHALRYTWKRYGDVTLIDRIGWVFTDGTHPQYEVAFTYEGRGDKISDCKAGFELLLDQRLARVDVFAHGARLRHYDLTYEDYATSGGFTRLTGVQMLGADDGVYPVHHGFEYSRALGVDCQAGQDCAEPYVVAMGALGVDIGQGKATLIDIDGNSLPDVLDTTEVGQPHRFFLNVLGADGAHGFAAPFESSLGNQGSHALGTPYVQVLDVNGDGFTDLVNQQTGDVLLNRGEGDWAEVLALGAGGGLPDLGAEGNLTSVKFFDYDGDKRIDLMLSRFSGAANETLAWRNTPGGFVADEGVLPIGEGFEAPVLELNDMNGDGLLDVVQVQKDSLRYRLDLGWGHWSDWRVVTGFDFTDQEAIDAELEDMNGDSLADLVLVAGNEIRYWINRNGTTFDDERTLTSADVQGDLPEKKQGTTVLYADMNGNGSSDVVWVQGAESGSVTYLELFPVRPNLLARITNGLGRVTDVSYGSSVVERARDSETSPWQHALPTPMTVVTSTDEWDQLTATHTVNTFAYHAGYYDGVEKRFRGYASVENALEGDDLQETGVTYETFDVGVADPYRAGLTLAEEQVSEGRSLKLTTSEHADCAVAEVPDEGLRWPVRNVCKTHEVEEHREGAPADQWARIETTWAYDGYGNVARAAQLGVTSVGGAACRPCEGAGYTGAPCGPDCLGDEAYTHTEYAVPADNDDRWILDKVVRVRTFGVANAEGSPATDQVAETRTYYDGEAFTGLPAGQVTHGAVTRIVEALAADGATATKARNRLDEHGNVVETLDALGTPGGEEHRRQYTMSADGLRLERVEVMNRDAVGAYALRQDVQYDPVWDKPALSSQWMVVADEVQDAANSTYYTYDEFGRLATRILPGDSLDAPSEAYTYELASPASRVVVQKRSEAGGAFDLEEVRCYDGRGRQYQKKEREGEGHYRVTGFTVYNLQGMERLTYDAYVSTSGQCDAAPPEGTRAMGTRYDALGRVAERIWPAAEEETDDARERTVYGPLTVADYDLEDTLTGGPHEGTPTVAHRNGLGKTVAIDHYLVAGGEPLTYEVLYDELGHRAGTIDPLGARHEQVHNLAGWVTSVDDPDSGLTTRDYDEVGNVVRTTDARGVAVRTAFDGVNRPVAQWDEADEAGTRIERTYDRPGDCPPAMCSNVAGRPVRVSYPLGNDRRGVDLHGYTARGLEAQTERSLDGRVFRFGTTYDHADRVVGNTYPDGRTVAIELNGTGEVAAVPGYVDQVTWDNRWLPSEFHLANGVVVRMARDGRKRLTSLAANGPGDATLLDLTYTRDRMGHVLDVVDGRPDDGQPSASAHYAYDALYRLASAELDPARPAWNETLTIAHDGGARIQSLTSSLGPTSAAHVGDYEYGQGAGIHAVSRAGDMSFGYDPAGNVTTRGDAAYTWDHLGRMVRATRGAEALSTWTYGPNPEHLMERSDGHVTYYLAGDFEVHDGVAVTYVMAPEERIARVEDPSFGPRVLPDVAPATGEDQSLAPAPDGLISAGDAWLAVGVANGELAFAAGATAGDATELLRASAMRTLLGGEPRVRYALHDHLGNSVAETDAAGAVVSRTGYYPFGALRHAGEGTDRHLFAGKVNNAATGLVEFGARSYDPWAGRWISPDPAFRVQEDVDPTDLPEATTAYGYVGGDPVNAHDPDGLSKVPDCSRFWGRVVATVKLRWGSSLRLSMGQMVRNRLLPGERPSLKVAWQSAKFAGRVGGWNKRDAFFDSGDKGIQAYGSTKSQLKTEYGQAQMELGSTSKRQDGKGFNVDLAVLGAKMLGKLGSKDAFALATQFEHSEYAKSGKVGIGEIGEAVYKSEAFNITTSSRVQLTNVQVNERVFSRKLELAQKKK